MFSLARSTSPDGEEKEDTADGVIDVMTDCEDDQGLNECSDEKDMISGNESVKQVSELCVADVENCINVALCEDLSNECDSETMECSMKSGDEDTSHATSLPVSGDDDTSHATSLPMSRDDDTSHATSLPVSGGDDTSHTTSLSVSGDCAGDNILCTMRKETRESDSDAFTTEITNGITACENGALNNEDCPNDHGDCAAETMD